MYCTKRYKSPTLISVLKDPPGAVSPDDGQSQRGQQADDRLKERPQRVDAAIGLEHAIVGRAKSLDLAVFLGERLDDADAGDRVGQHAGHFAPCPRAQGETRAASGCAPDARETR